MISVMRTTASKVGLLSKCAWWARPEAEWSNHKSDEADVGTRFHTQIAHYVAEGEVPEMADGVAPLFAVAKTWVDTFGREKLLAEVAFWWDPVTDTADDFACAHRDYAAMQAKGYLCGTADLVAVSECTRVGYIADWKTGDGTGAGPQLRALALMLARARRLDSVTVEALEVTADGVRHVCTEVLDAFALAAVAGELAENLAAVASAEPQPGDHCGEMFCQARVSCPVTQAVVAELVPAEALVPHRWTTEIASPEHALWLHERRKLLGSAVDAVNDALKKACPEGGWALPDGSVLAEGSRNMPRFDVEKLKSFARQAGVTDEQFEACSYIAKESAGLRVQKAAGAAKPRKRRAA